jgi:dienelactone hydrolase
VAEIVLFHSALGLRPGVLAAADRLRAAGHSVHTPDLFEGAALFDSVGPAMAYVNEIGIPTLAARAGAAVQPLPPGIVYAGFSLGASFAARLAATRPGARGALLFHGAPAPAQLRIQTWPTAVPVQIHFAISDPWRDNGAIAALTELIRASGSSCSVFDYPGSAHFFSDPDISAEYDPESSGLMWDRALEMLSNVSAT